MMIAGLIAPLATLVFLATLWALVVLGAAMLEDSGAKIAAALKGRPVRAEQLRLAPVRVRARRRGPVLRAEPRRRAAA